MKIRTGQEKYFLYGMQLFNRFGRMPRILAVCMEISDIFPIIIQ
jgi:hypothetical protein